MKNFCVITSSLKDEKYKMANNIKQYISDNNGTCIIKDCIDSKTGKFQFLNSEEMPQNLECVITIGGDGTLLHSARDLRQLDISLIGINKGRLGFLAEISPENTEEAISRLMNDDFNVESRMMLQGEVYRNGKKVFETSVLNDIVVHRGGDITMSRFDVFVNNQLLGAYYADGVILSTPTGSTAYNLSAGGPVARPDSHMIILTPICSHSIGSRSVLLSRNDEIEINIGNSKKSAYEDRKISFDGDNIFNTISGDKIKIKEAKEITKIAKLDEGSFLQVVKKKLGE